MLRPGSPQPPQRARRKIAVKILSSEDPSPRVFPKLEITVGSAEHCDLRLPDGTDEVHCLVALTAHGYVVEDLGSSTGTMVMGRRIARAFVDPGQIVTVGTERFVLLPL